MSDYCPHCGQVIAKLNPHRMDAAKVKLLDKIAQLNLHGVEWVKVQRDGNLIRPVDAPKTIQCDDVHALRLTWFNLLENAGFRTGLYRVTRQGFLFLCGQYAVPSVIECKGGLVITQSSELVFIKQVRKVIYDKNYWDEYWKHQRPDPRIASAQPQLL